MKIHILERRSPTNSRIFYPHLEQNKILENSVGRGVATGIVVYETTAVERDQLLAHLAKSLNLCTVELRWKEVQ